MEVSGQLHSPAALFPEGPFTNCMGSWVWTRLEREKYMLLPGLESQSYIPYERTEIEKMLDT
jgi:hypothetical protein